MLIFYWGFCSFGSIRQSYLLEIVQIRFILFAIIKNELHAARVTKLLRSSYSAVITRSRPQILVIPSYFGLPRLLSRRFPEFLRGPPYDRNNLEKVGWMPWVRSEVPNDLKD